MRNTKCENGRRTCGKDEDFRLFPRWFEVVSKAGYLSNVDSTVPA